MGRAEPAYPVSVPIVVYSVLRLGLFGVCFAVLLLAGAGSWLAVVLAAFGAWGLSYVLLARPRDAAALALAERAERRRQGHRFAPAIEADEAVEDAEADAVRRAEDEHVAHAEGEHPSERRSGLDA